MNENLNSDSVFLVAVNKKDCDKQFGQAQIVGEPGLSQVVEIDGKGAYTVKPIKTVTAMGRLQLALAAGTHEVSKNLMYFCPQKVMFVHRHPDLSWGDEWMLAAQPPNVIAYAPRVASRVRGLGDAIKGVISRAEIDAWEQRQLQNTTHLVAFSDHPVWALILGEMALSMGWLVRTNTAKGRAPTLLPSMNPSEWDAWLQSDFSLDSIRRARIALGITNLNTQFSTTESTEINTEAVDIDPGNLSAHF